MLFSHRSVLFYTIKQSLFLHEIKIFSPSIGPLKIWGGGGGGGDVQGAK